MAKLKNEPKFIAEGENNKQQIIEEHYSRIQYLPIADIICNSGVRVLEYHSRLASCVE